MKKTILMIISLVLLASCATSTTQTYRAEGQMGSAWNISGEYNKFTKKLIIKVDGDEAIKGSIPIFSTSAELRGKYKNKRMSASCDVTRSGFNSKLKCIVFVNSERAATLQF